jgi:copper(I)-binding protein
VSIDRRRLAAVAAAAVLVPSLSGCWAGFDAQTSMQANQAVGNGTNMSTGDMEIRGATWVRNVANPEEATLVATFVNNADLPDKLVKVDVEPTSPMGITAGAIDIPTVGSVRTGYWSPNFVNAFRLQAFPSTFVPTTLTFQNAGTVTADVIAVPNTGQYQGVVVALADQQELQALVSGSNEPTGTDAVKKAKEKQQATEG